VLLRDPLDPSLAGSLSRERPWCSCCRPVAEPEAEAKASPVQTGRRTVVSRGKIGLSDMDGTAPGKAVPVTRPRRRAGGAVAPEPSPPADGGGRPSAARPHKHTIRLYPRVKISAEDRSAFAVFDQFNVEELGAWRVFGLRFLREKTGRARCCRCTSAALFVVAAAAQVLLGMLEQSAMSWLPTVTMLVFGLTLGLALMSHLKMQAVDDLNKPRCGGPSGRRFAKWLRANAMALRLNALELELVDETHSDAILQHEVEDLEAKKRSSDAGRQGPASPVARALPVPPAAAVASPHGSAGSRGSSRRHRGRGPSSVSEDARLEAADDATDSGGSSPRGRRFVAGARQETGSGRPGSPFRGGGV